MQALRKENALMAAPPSSSSSNATLILVLGILGLFCTILGPVAWIMGNNALATADPSQASTINAGRICGIIGTVFLVIGIIYWILVAVGFAHFGGMARPTAPTP